MEKQGGMSKRQEPTCETTVLTSSVPMQQYPQSPDVTGQPPAQPPVYHQDPNAQYHQQQQQMHAQSPPPQQPQQAYPAPSPNQDAYSQAAAKHEQPQPGMPPQQPSGAVYQNATPIASLGRGPAPADCPACGQRSMTNCAFETGNTTQ
jgi:lipopolysaccharide-induced tumor necrosis factor-alpha factor